MKSFHAVAVLSLLLTVPVFAQTTPAPKASAAKAAPAAKPAATPTVHATKGVVKSVDATSLVISKVAGKGPDTTFMLNSSTQKQGTLVAGASVDVRYHKEGKDNVATAVTVHEATPAKPKAKSTK